KLDEQFTDTFGQEDAARQKQLKQALLKKRRSAQNRIDENTRHLVEHFITGVKSRGFKGLLVCDGRNMAVRYKDTLDALMAERAAAGLETFESRVVISLGGITENRTGIDQEQAVADAAGRYDIKGKLQTIEERVRDEIKAGKAPVAVPTEDIPKLVNETFKKPYGDEAENDDQVVRFCNIGLLIVSDMLLTGWDAPIVSTLYLDKPLKEHTLLQAIARVNRTRKGKNAGYIVDYFGVVDHLDQALSIYSGDDTKITSDQIWTDIESELPRLEMALQKLLGILPRMHDLLTQPEPYKEDADLFLDPDTRPDAVDEFLAAFKAFNARLDIVLPDERGARYKPFFKVLGEIKLALRHKLPDDAHKGPLNQLESALLQQLLDEHIEADEVRSLLGREVSILDANDMERLRKLKSLGSQALTMKNQLKHTIATGKQKNPGFFEPLEEALKKLIEDEKEKRIEQAEFLRQLELFSQKVRDKAAGARHAGFADPAQVAVFDYLNDRLGKSGEGESQTSARQWTEALFADGAIQAVLASPIWKDKTEIHKELQKLIRKRLRAVAGWDMKTAKQHATSLFDILLKN
ncbi:type I restriction enzyme subunit R domain-containing protein, partial [Sansalvadorimonas verongulae]|uniref:type I restriction enzyme subunit R domain-containing protein n=1 Tax=Sansalvadorimonas verongulae TaxID=2172824 RepID=UPI0012BCB9F1